MFVVSSSEGVSKDIFSKYAVSSLSFSIYFVYPSIDEVQINCMVLLDRIFFYRWQYRIKR